MNKQKVEEIALREMWWRYNKHECELARKVINAMRRNPIATRVAILRALDEGRL